jgi:hypothetical protein
MSNLFRLLVSGKEISKCELIFKVVRRYSHIIPIRDFNGRLWNSGFFGVHMGTGTTAKVQGSELCSRRLSSCLTSCEITLMLVPDFRKRIAGRYMLDFFCVH